MNITLSSHILDSSNGKSVVGIRCRLSRLDSNDNKTVIFDVEANEEGRIIESFEVDSDSTRLELEMFSADYFRRQISVDNNCVEQIVIRFRTVPGKERYHMPVMLSPHSYSTWWSS